MKTDLSGLVPLGFVIIFVVFVLCLVPNAPRIIITESNQSSEAETKSDFCAKSIRESLGFFEVTAYCPNECCCGEYADGITASGEFAIGKFCAADSIIPFGLELDIPGYGIVPVLDRGGKIKGRKLDVFFPTHQEALEWGRQKLEIHCWVLDDI